MTDYDSPWKEMLENYFPAFMAFFFPEAYRDIDWDRGYESLDKELQQIVRDAELGKRLADKLMKVWRLSGEEQMVMIHTEIQGEPEEPFPKRMYVYNYRTFDRYDRPVVSLAVLSDTRRDWRPDRYGYPNTGTAPIFRRRRDAEITKAIYSRCPVLVDRRTDPPKQVWPVRYMRIFDMTNDSHLFKRRDELEAEGFYPVGGNVWRKGNEAYVPLYEGKMVQAYDHRAASIVVNPNNLHRPAQPEPASLEQHQNVNWLPQPQFWVSAKLLHNTSNLLWVICFKHITAPTNIRTMIASVAPYFGFGNSIPIFLPALGRKLSDYKNHAPLLLANLNCIALDFLLRQKVQGQNLNLFIIEQLPIIAVEKFQESIGDQKIADFIRDQVLHLVYTAVDMKPFAEDMGYGGEPFVWDEDDRRHRLARLDALFFHLYGLDRKDAAYILDQFPIVREQDERQFGRYLTRDLILAYMNAVAAGDLDVTIRL